MDKNKLPESFGAFKPVNHVVMAFPSAAELDAALQDLVQDGFSETTLTHYTPEEMIRQADRELANAGIMASIGQELNLVRSHRDLALQGHGFLVVPFQDDDDVQRLTALARKHQASRAQRYGRLLIEELIEVGDGLSQVGESPARGLDAQTASGEERDIR